VVPLRILGEVMDHPGNTGAPTDGGVDELELYVKKMLGDAFKSGSIDKGAYAKIKDKVRLGC
jgi:hypothetical protein